jgi:GT2 family glycosyltransferase
VAAYPRIGAIIVSRDEGADLRRTVHSALATLPKGSDIVVVDDGSTDGSAGRRALGRNIRVMRTDGVGVTRARNLGARSSRGDVVVFLDAHVRLPEGWWRPLVELLKRPETGAVAPLVADFKTAGRTGCGLTFCGPAMDVRWLKRKRKQASPAPILPGCCLAMRRDVFAATGGWDEGMLHYGNVDNEFSIRHWLLGYELLVTPEIVVRHKFRHHPADPVPPPSICTTASVWPSFT